MQSKSLLTTKIPIQTRLRMVKWDNESSIVYSSLSSKNTDTLLLSQYKFDKKIIKNLYT